MKKSIKRAKFSGDFIVKNINKNLKNTSPETANYCTRIPGYKAYLKECRLTLAPTVDQLPHEGKGKIGILMYVDPLDLAENGMFVKNMSITFDCSRLENGPSEEYIYDYILSLIRPKRAAKKELATDQQG